MLDWLIGRGVQSDQVTEAALVHLPVYVYKYDFAGKSYSAMVEGASGKVFANIFPAKAETPYFMWRRYPAALPVRQHLSHYRGLFNRGAGLGLGLLACLGAGGAGGHPHLRAGRAGVGQGLNARRHHRPGLSQLRRRAVGARGQRIVKCPYCNARSLVRGERGVRRYQVARRVERERAAQPCAASGAASTGPLTFRQGPDRRAVPGLPALLAGPEPDGRLDLWREARQLGQVVALRAARGAADARRRLDRRGRDVAEFGVERIGLAGTEYAAYDPKPFTSRVWCSAHRLADRGQRRRRPAWEKYAAARAASTGLARPFCAFCAAL